MTQNRYKIYVNMCKFLIKNIFENFKHWIFVHCCFSHGTPYFECEECMVTVWPVDNVYRHDLPHSSELDNAIARPNKRTQ